MVTLSKATIDSEEYQEMESNAATDGNDWANDNLILIIKDDGEDNNHTALSATELPAEPNNFFVPQSFQDTFNQMHRHLWYPAMM